MLYRCNVLAIALISVISASNDNKEVQSAYATISDGTNIYHISEIGCNSGTVYASALAYADNIVLLAPKASAMHSLLKSMLMNYTVMLNDKKSACIYSFPCKCTFPENACH